MARESAADRLERKRRKTGKDKTAQDLRRVGGAMAGAGKALFGTEGGSASQKLERRRAEERAAKRKPTSGLRGTELNRERGMSNRQLNPRTMTAAERRAAGRTKQSRRGNVKVTKEAPAFTKVERQPKTSVKAPKSDMKTNMSEARSNVSADRGTGTGLPRTIGSARKQAEAQGTKAKTFMPKSGKAKAAVTAEELAKFRKKAGNTNLTYRGALRKFINERDGLTPKKPYETKKKVAKKAGGMMKAKGMKAGGKMKTKGMKAGGKVKKLKAGGFPDLTGDGKVTRKDVLKGRGVPGMKAGGKMKTKGYMAGGKMKTKGYKKGGKVKKLRGAGIESRGYRPIKMR
jgi:hypothetical protein